MKILSWNVNGIRSVEKKGFLEWVYAESPDILCLQETKAHPDQLSDNLLNPRGYKTYWSAAQKKGYSGVALFAKVTPQKVDTGIGVKKFDIEGRTLIADFGPFVLFNIYYPNGGAGNKRVPFKMSFYDTFLKVADDLRKKGKKLVICGDLNTAHAEIDLARPKENEKNTGFLPEERAWVSKFISRGYIDTFRHFNQEPGYYTWWDYKTGARARNVGWRIDYFFVTTNLLANLKSAFILKDVMGSDHCPVGIELEKL
ncbi:MAG TPA: exodeoxyribonuclease III [Candidatus Omnitrophota bacterium]|nr:exodeoxyribonuclease III [Candidatus Omnitrophota bacterium]HPD85450.1 exodeoxyribonuclease III [Candidatus Omnitrophota bacterium]HRZ04049.1 exodeoxyribonuclease III [Candidatus Omnitrophota bacterium]